jgi:glycosyltransferase involved in cell wall biosynthesis
LESKYSLTSPAANIVFWQKIPSIHQAPIIRELSRLTTTPVLVVAENDVSAERREQGWQRPDFGLAKLKIGPSRRERVHVLEETSKESIHVFTGIQAYPETYWTFRQAVGCGATVGLYSEPIDDSGWRGSAKRGLYRMHALRWGSRLDFLLLTGQRAQDWFAARGFPKERIFPYGYFVAWPEIGSTLDVPDSSPRGDQFEWVFLGQLVPRKGLDLLLQSLARLPEARWQLRVIGVGPDAGTYKNAARELGVAARVEWVGAVPNRRVQDFLISADALVLPSRFDGWGAVVNEALSVGTPVVVSDACGAAELVAESERGEVFRTNSIPALTAALGTQLAKGRVGSMRRAAIRNWAAASIAPVVAAEYLLGVMAHVRNGAARLDPPWLRSPPTGADLR